MESPTAVYYQKENYVRPLEVSYIFLWQLKMNDDFINKKSTTKASFISFIAFLPPTGHKKPLK